MASGKRIVQDSDIMAAAATGAGQAAETLRSAQSALSSAIPGNAFGLAGAPVAVAGNQLGAKIGETLASLAKLAELTARGTTQTNAEFARIEDEAARIIAQIQIGPTG